MRIEAMGNLGTVYGGEGLPSSGLVISATEEETSALLPIFAHRRDVRIIEDGGEKALIEEMLTEFKKKNLCSKNFHDCLECENHKECNAIRNVIELILQGHLLKESDVAK